MQAIKCELCGSNQLIKKDSFFQCQHCGTKYTLEEAKKLIVSGTVEITKGEAEKQRLLKNGNLFIIENDFENANKVYELLRFEYPNDPSVKKYSTELLYKRTVYECDIEKNDILNKFNNFYKKLLSGKTIQSRNEFYIINNLFNINQKRELLINHGIDDLSSIDNIEFAVIEEYNNLTKNRVNDHFKKQLIFHYNKCYFTDKYEKMQYTFSNIISNWMKKLTNEFLDEIEQGKNSFQELLDTIELWNIIVDIDRRKQRTPKVDTQFWNIFIKGIECGKFLNSNKYLVDDLLIDKMYPYHYSEEILFALGNSLSVITDKEYLINTTEYKTKPIVDLSYLQMLSTKKNSNKFCKKCGGTLQGVFSKTCTRCHTKY